MDEVMLNACIEEQDKVNRVSGTWTTLALTNIVKLCSNMFGFPVDKDNVKNRLRTLKKYFSSCHDLFVNSSGFAWNPETKLFVAESRVWREKIEGNADAGKWRYTPVLNYDKLEALFAKNRATGNGVVSAKEKVCEWERQENHVIVDEGTSFSPSSYDPSSPGETASFPATSFVPTSYMPNYESDPTPKNSKKIAMTDLFEKSLDVMHKRLIGVTEALKEGNVIAEKSCPKVYSEEEAYNELQNIGVPPENRVNALLHLLRNPVDMRAFFSVPQEMRFDLPYKLMYGSGSQG